MCALLFLPISKASRRDCIRFARDCRNDFFKPMKSSVQAGEFLDLAVRDAISRASGSLLNRQSSEGYWWADLRADSTLESDYILMELWLHPPVNGAWNPPTRPKIERAAAAILARQLEDGGFNIYRKGPAEVNASIKAYFALKVAGVDVSDARMLRLRAGRRQLRWEQRLLSAGS